MKNTRHLTSAAALVPILVVTLASAALASSSNTVTPGSGTGSLPWEGGLASLTSMLTGPTARYISIIAIFIAGLGLIFGEDMGGFARKMLMIVIAAAFLIFASSFIGLLSGASI